MFDLEKLNILRDLSRIPSNGGEQFIHICLNLMWEEAGDIHFGFKWKTEMGTLEFRTLDEAIEKVKELRRRAKL